jgi:hypothetical protein
VLCLVHAVVVFLVVSIAVVFGLIVFSWSLLSMVIIVSLLLLMMMLMFLPNSSNLTTRISLSGYGVFSRLRRFVILSRANTVNYLAGPISMPLFSVLMLLLLVALMVARVLFGLAGILALLSVDR